MKISFSFAVLFLFVIGIAAVTPLLSRDRSPGNDRSELTASSVSPDVLTRIPFQIGTTQAMVSGLVNGYGYATTCSFQWGVDTSYGSVTGGTNVTSTDAVSFYSQITGLRPATTYHYRAKAVSAGGTVWGDDYSFTTLASSVEYSPDEHTVALYHCNEISRDYLQDYSSHGNNAMLSGTGVVAGKYGFGRSFNLTNEFLTLPIDPAFEFPNGRFTIEAWILPNLQGQMDFTVAALGTASAGTEAFRFTALKTGDLDMMVNPSGAIANEYHTYTSGGPLSGSRWRHIAAAVDLINGKIQLFIDGELQSTSSSGTFPSSINITTENLLIGLSQKPTVGFQIENSASASLDEIRISDIARPSSDFHVGGAISGLVFNDADGDGKLDGVEAGMSGWKVLLFHGSASMKSDIVDTVITNSSGNYLFNALDDGKYYVIELQQDWWIQTYPHGKGGSLVTIRDGSVSDKNNFGNVFGYAYEGSSNGVWSHSANWSSGHAPGSDDPVIIPPGTTVTVDALPNDSINALRVRSGGRLAFQSINHRLKIRGNVQIDSGAILSFPPTPDLTGLQCYGDWIDHGSFDPGNSTIIFEGDSLKSIIWSPGTLPVQTLFRKTLRTLSVGNGNEFWNLVIAGANTNTLGNVIIDNTLVLDSSLTPQPQDTVFILPDEAGTISGAGKILRGTISRQIHSGSIDQYRFESEGSFIQFNAGSSYPGAITETATPNTVPRSFQLHWEPMGGLVDSVNHTISIEHVTHFSNWSIGRPGGLSKPPVPDARVLQSGFDTNKVIKRLYKIIPDGNNGQFNAALSLRYDPAELDAAALQADLQLYRGPYAVNALEQGWNMISLPVVPESSLPPVLFPSMVSQAFSYAGGYHPQTSLNAGTGYWMKFPAAVSDTMLGNDIEQLSIPVQESWNMIGALSYLTDVANISSPDGVSFGPVFGYEHGYKIQDTLKPLHGYWIKADKAGTLLLQAPSMSSLAAAAAKTSGHQLGSIMSGQLQRLNSLVVRDAGGNEQVLYFGREGAVANVHLLEMPPVPPQGTFDARFAGNMLAALAPQAGARDVAVMLSASQYPVTLTWQITSPLGAGSAVQVGTHTTLLGAKSGSTTIADAREAAGIVLHIEGNGRSGSDVPKKYALHQNYPNPFNPATEIGFDLPEAGRVRLTIYNILGQEVARVIDGEQFNAGRYSRQVTLNQVASGVYFYKLTAGEFTAVRKMLYVR